MKSVTLKRNDIAEFPDAVTARGAKHLAELANQVAAGDRAVMLYMMQRGDAAQFAIAADIDPGYAVALEAAMAAGVEALCYRCRVAPDEIVIDGPVAIRAPGGA